MSKPNVKVRFPKNARWIAVAAGWVLASCTTTPSTRAPDKPTAPIETGALQVVPAGAREWHVQPEASLLQIFVYRGGSMARLGHNHVIAARNLGGVVYVTDDPLQTRFDLTIPVAELSIDEPELRERAGADFPRDVPQSARDGTRKNLLSVALLDGEQYPVIRLRATDVAAAADGYDVGVAITVKDLTVHKRVALQVTRDASRVNARGKFALTQTELGLKPFSAAMGALIVVDEMKIEFDVTAGP